MNAYGRKGTGGLAICVFAALFGRLRSAGERRRGQRPAKPCSSAFRRWRI